jgi:hypothetical protein
MCYRATYASEEIGIRPLDDAAFDFGLWLKALTLKMRPPCSSFLLLIKASVLHRALTPRAQAGTICSSEPAQSQSCKRAQSSLYDMAGTRQCRWYIGSTSAGCCDFQNKICIPIYKYNIYIYIYIYCYCPAAASIGVWSRALACRVNSEVPLSPSAVPRAAPTLPL